MKHSPSWNKFVEHFHGDDDVVFGDETLLKYHVRQVNGVWRMVQDPLLQPRNRIWQQHIPEEDQPGHAQRTRSKMEYMQQYVKEQGDTPLCNVNRVEKGTGTLDEDQGEVPTVGEDRDTIHGSEGVRWRSGRRVAVRQQDDAQVDRDWPEEGINAVSSVSSVRRTNASRRQEQLEVNNSEKRQDFRQGGFAMGFVATRRGVGRAWCGDSTSTGGARSSTATSSTRHADRSISKGMSASRSAH